MRSVVAGALLFMVLGSAAQARAQTLAEPPEPEPGPERNFKGHTFLTPVFTQQSFVATRFAFTQGVASASIPEYPLTQNRSLDVDLLGVLDKVDLSIRIFDRFELSVGGTVEAFSGIDLNSAITLGASYNYSINGGAKARLLRLENTGTELSAFLDGSHGPNGSLQILRMLEAVVATPPASVNAIIDGDLRRLATADGSTSRVGMQLLAAQVLSRNFSLQGGAGADYSWEETTYFDPELDEDVTLKDNALSPRLGLAFEATIQPILPLGFLLEYSLRNGRKAVPTTGEFENDTSHLVGIGAHIVHPQFQTGITYGRFFGLDPVQRVGILGNQFESDTPALNYVQLNLAFTWY